MKGSLSLLPGSNNEVSAGVATCRVDASKEQGILHKPVKE